MRLVKKKNSLNPPKRVGPELIHELDESPEAKRPSEISAPSAWKEKSRRVS